MEDRKILLFLFIGGMIGAIFRYATSEVFAHLFSTQSFPYATLVINLTGCFLLSFLLTNIKIINKWPPILLTAVTTGAIGSFTTFSTVTIELVQLFSKSPLYSIIYFLAHLLGMLILCYFGYFLAKKKAGE